MSRLAQAIRSHRESNRNRRDLGHALQTASPAMRDELLVLAQRHELLR